MIILNVDTSDNNFILLSLDLPKKITRKRKIQAYRQQSEKLLSAIAKLLADNKLSPKDISKIRVEHRGSSFTSLRIGVLCANALAYALGIEIETIVPDKKYLKKLKNFSLVLPKYSRDPDIKIASNKI